MMSILPTKPDFECANEYLVRLLADLQMQTGMQVLLQVMHSCYCAQPVSFLPAIALLQLLQRTSYVMTV